MRPEQPKDGGNVKLGEGGTGALRGWSLQEFQLCDFAFLMWKDKMGLAVIFLSIAGKFIDDLIHFD